MTKTDLKCDASIRTTFINNLKKEHSLFKYRMLSACSRHIYDSCNKIYFYECMYEYFIYNENVDDNVIAQLSKNEYVLESLYNYYLSNENSEVSRWNLIDEMIDMYINH